MILLVKKVEGRFLFTRENEINARKCFFLFDVDLAIDAVFFCFGLTFCPNDDCVISRYSSTRSAVLDGTKYIFHMGSLNIINIRECRITYSIARKTCFMTFLITFLIISPRVRNGSLLSASVSGTSGVCSEAEY